MNKKEILTEYEALRTTLVYLLEESDLSYGLTALHDLKFTCVVEGSKDLISILKDLPFESYVIDELNNHISMIQYIYELLDSYNPKLDNVQKVVQLPTKTCGCPNCTKNTQSSEENILYPTETNGIVEMKRKDVPVERIQNDNTHFEQFLADEVHKFYGEDITLQEFIYLFEVAPREQRQPLLNNLNSLMKKMQQKIRTETPTTREQMKLLYKIARR